MVQTDLGRLVSGYVAHLRFSGRNVGRWVNQKESMLLDFCSWAGARNLGNLERIEPYHLDEWLSALAKVGRAPATLNKRAIVVRHMARWAVERGHLKAAPLALLRIPAPAYAVPELPTYRVMERLVLTESNEDRRAFYMMALYTGMRRQEVFNLRWQDCNLEEGYAYVRHTTRARTKTARSRTVPLCEVLRDLLAERKERPDLAGPFLRLDGKPLFQPNRLSALWRQASRGEKLDLRLHMLRHAFCTHILQDLKADIVSAQAVMGHATVRTTQLYTHPDPSTPRRIARLQDREHLKRKPAPTEAGAEESEPEKEPSEA